MRKASIEPAQKVSKGLHSANGNLFGKLETTSTLLFLTSALFQACQITTTPNLCVCKLTLTFKKMQKKPTSALSGPMRKANIEPAQKVSNGLHSVNGNLFGELETTSTSLFQQRYASMQN